MMPSVIRSDVLNFWLIVIGVTVAAVVAVGRVGGVDVMVRRLAVEAPCEAVVPFRDRLPMLRRPCLPPQG